MQTDRKRLIDLITKEVPRPKADALADYLLANGVIVPPCKIGNTVWWADNKRVLDMVCVGFVQTHKKFLVTIARNTNVFTTRYNAIWNKEVFLTKEEAEAELRKRSENNV